MESSDKEQFYHENNEYDTVDLADPHSDVFDTQLKEEMLKQQLLDDKNGSPGDSRKKKNHW